jgi:hypothetical protein
MVRKEKKYFIIPSRMFGEQFRSFVFDQSQYQEFIAKGLLPCEKFYYNLRYRYRKAIKKVKKYDFVFMDKYPGFCSPFGNLASEIFF